MCELSPLGDSTTKDFTKLNIQVDYAFNLQLLYYFFLRKQTN